MAQIALSPEESLRLIQLQRERNARRQQTAPAVSGFQPQAQPAPALFPEAGVSAPRPELPIEQGLTFEQKASQRPWFLPYDPSTLTEAIGDVFARGDFSATEDYLKNLKNQPWNILEKDGVGGIPTGARRGLESLFSGDTPTNPDKAPLSVPGQMAFGAGSLTPFLAGYGATGLGTKAVMAGGRTFNPLALMSAMAENQMTASALNPTVSGLAKTLLMKGAEGTARGYVAGAGLEGIGQMFGTEDRPIPTDPITGVPLTSWEQIHEAGKSTAKFMGPLQAVSGVSAAIPSALGRAASEVGGGSVGVAMSGGDPLSPDQWPFNAYQAAMTLISKRPVARAKFVEKVRGGTDRPKAVSEIVSDPAMYSELDNALKADRPDLTDEARKAILDDVVAEFRVLTGADPTPAETKALSENIGAKTIAGEFTKQNPRYETYARGLIDFYTGVRKDFPKMVDDKGQQLPKEAHVLRRRIEAAIKKQPAVQTPVAPTVAPEPPKPRDFKAMPDVDLDVAIGMLRTDMVNASGKNKVDTRQELVTALREKSSRQKAIPTQVPVERATSEDAQAKILAILPTEGKPLLADDIANQTGLLPQDVASALMNLEIQKKISKSKGGYLKPTEAVEAPKVEEPAETVTPEPTPLPGETPEQAKARMAEEDAADANLHIPMSREEFAMGRPVEEQNGMLVRYDGKDTDGNGKWTLYDETGQNPLSAATKSKAELERLGFTAFGEDTPVAAPEVAPVTVEPIAPATPEPVAPEVTGEVTGEVKPPASDTGDGKVVMRMMPLDQLSIRPEEYQPRSEPFSEETVAKIGKVGFSDEAANIKAFVNPVTGNAEILGGFSTAEAAKRANRENVPVRMVDIPQWSEDIGMDRPATPEAIVKAAKLYAKMDNEFATPQNSAETLRSLKELRDDGVPEKAIREMLGPTKFAALDALSHLKPDGKFMSMLGPTDAEIVGKDRLVAAAKVVGRMRRDFPDQFKTVHEEEVFDYMTEGGKVKDVSMKKLESVIRERINDPAFASDALGDKSLDLKNKSERLEWYGGKYNPNRKDLAEKYTELANRQEEAITQQEKDAIGEQMMAVKDQIKRTDDDQADLFGMNAFFGFVPPAELKRLGVWLGKQSGVLPQGQHGGPPTLLSVSKMVDDVLNRVKTLNTSGLKGSKLAKDNLIEQDRWVRAAEFISKSLERVVQDAVPDEARQIAILHAYENKFQGPHWNALSTEERNVAAFIAREKRKLTQFIKDNDVITPMDESKFWHISHHWINPKTDKPYDFKYGKFSKAVPQAKPRTIETLEDGIAQGLKPATTNPGKLIGMSWENIMKAHVNRTVFKSLSDIESASQAGTILRPGSKNPSPLRMVERWDVLKDQGLTDNYVRYDHPVLDKKIVVPQKNGSAMLIEGPVGVDKEIFPFVKAYLESPEYNSLDKLNFAVKSLRLGLSLFHASALGMQEIANLRVPFVNIPRGKKYIADLSPEMQILHQEGLELFKGLEDVGYKNSFFDDAFKVKNVPVGKAGNMVLKPVEIMRDFIFDVVQPGMKAAFAVDMYNKMYPKYRAESLDKNSKHFGETEDKMRSRLARDVVEKADGHFSGEHYKRSLLETNRFMARAYFSPSSRKFWQRIMLSPTWNREHFIVAKNVAKSLLPESDVARFGMKEMGPIRSQYRRYLLGGLLMIGTANLLNRDATEEMDGEARNIWDNPTGKKFSVRGKWNEPPYEADVKGKDEQEALYEKMANAIISKNNEEYESALVELEKKYTFNKKHLGAVISAVRKGEPIPELTRTVEGGGAYYRPLKSVFEVAEWSTDPFGKSTHKLSPLISAFGEQVFESGFKYQEGLKSFPKRAKDIIGDIAVPMSATEVLNWIQEEKTATGALIPMAGFPTSKEKTKDSAAMYYNRIAKAFLDGNREEALDLVVEYENLGFNYDPKKTQIYMRRIEQENKK